jgi:ubiquitin carboxyl-terminal hydrolase 34
VDITKFQCFSELNDSIVFHLKRFEINFDTFRREKVNDSFPFPKMINMKPFTKEYILESISGSSDNTSVDRLEGDKDSDDGFIYELFAVVVHTGTTDSGHYFTYIKEPTVDDIIAMETGSASTSQTSTTSKSRWIEFNDAEISLFSELLLESECFGGTTVMHEILPKSQGTTTYAVENPKNAYMLIYNRKNPLSSVEIPLGE